jgi:hypothetical protein
MASPPGPGACSALRLPSLQNPEGISLRRCAALLLGLAVWLPVPAYAGGFSTYISAYKAITPAIAGVRVRVPSTGEDINVANTGSTPLIVYGYQGDQYLKITSHGVWQNKLSPATYLNKEQTIGNLPQDANASKPPVWVKISDTDHAQWHDHRIHWMGVSNAPIVQKDPKHAHLINNWKIPVSSGGLKAEITGTLTYEPGGHLGTDLTYGAIGLAVVVILGLQIVILRRRKAAPDADAVSSEVEDSRL